MLLEFTAEQEELRAFVREVFDQRIDKVALREADDKKIFPQQYWDVLTEAGLHGMAVPKEYGGMSGSFMDQVIVEEELGRVVGGQATVWSINTHTATVIDRHGSQAQKDHILPKLANGELRIALSFTEPGGGTDLLGALKTHAERRNGGGWVINGSKVYTTMADDSQLFAVLARTSVREKKNQGLTVFLVDADRKGLEWTRMPTLGQAPIGTFSVYYTDVEARDDEVLGEPDNGWACLMESINHERIIIAACCTGTIKGVIDRVVPYAKERHAFGKPIGQFQSIQHFIADMEVSYHAARLLTYRAAGLAMAGKRFDVESAAAKLFASEACSRACDMGIQILGGAGYVKDYEIERFWRDTRIMRIGPISNEMVRNIVAEQLGLPRSF
ncbi:MAG: acyl-CoA dehydrogenase [Actinobacteria bacterium]|nr:acyl-CoA dehydrogenase [Actinomycetota bacterium]